MLHIKNNSLNFIETGKGEKTLVFLHYFGGSAGAWSLVINELDQSFRCIAIDLPGFGRSSAPAEALSVAGNAQEVIQLIQHLQLQKFVLIGHSMGGKIALAIASQKPAGLVSLILVAPSPPTPEPMNDEARKDLTAAFGNRPAIEKLIKKITAQPLTDIVFEETVQDHLRVDKTAWNGWIKVGSGEDISARMSAIDVPVSIISGAADPNFPTAFLRTEFSNYFSSAHFEEIPGTGHLLPVEVPSATAASIQKFTGKGIDINE